MRFRLGSIDETDTELFGMSPSVREAFVVALRELAASDAPLSAASGWLTVELRQNQRIAPKGLFSSHVGKL